MNEEMKPFVNNRVQDILGTGKEASVQVRRMMQEMWRGGRLLACCTLDGRSLPVRLEGMNCLPVFTSQERGERFGQMLILRGGPQTDFREETMERLLTGAKDAGFALAIDPGTEDCLILPANILDGIRRLTMEVTGGVMPEEDLPLMRLHLGTVGNFDRVGQSVNCGCYRCETVFPAAEATAFMQEENGSRTAVCPRCRTDAVLTDRDAEIGGKLLHRMNRRFFAEAGPADAGLRLLYMESMKDRIREEKQNMA